MYMYTVTGKQFNFIEPNVDDVDIKDIATGLSNICRYSGQLNTFYSVAQHSVLVSRVVSEEYALEALLHDASEAYIGDVITPVKQFLPDYKKIEHNLMSVIARRFELNYPFNVAVEHADKILLNTEIRDLKGNARPVCYAGVEFGAMPLEIEPLAPNEAKKFFLKEFEYLWNKKMEQGNQEEHTKRFRFSGR